VRGTVPGAAGEECSAFGPSSGSKDAERAAVVDVGPDTAIIPAPATPSRTPVSTPMTLSTPTADDRLRALLARLLDWRDAHADFDAAVDGLTPALRGVRPTAWPHSPWELVEHMRITQRDILDFCVDPGYVELEWPDDYWPPSAEPPSADAWAESIAGYRRDRDALRRLAADPAVDLFAPVPAGTGQTYVRELLLVADHTAYHVGQLVAARRALGAWPA
jgi:hypothetical protein